MFSSIKHVRILPTEKLMAKDLFCRMWAGCSWVPPKRYFNSFLFTVNIKHLLPNVVALKKKNLDEVLHPKLQNKENWIDYLRNASKNYLSFFTGSIFDNGKQGEPLCEDIKRLKKRYQVCWDAAYFCLNRRVIMLQIKMHISN